GAEAHGAAEVGLPRDGVALVCHRRDHRIGRIGIELRRVRPGDSHRSGRLDDDALKPEAQTEYRQPALARVADRADLALDTPDTEAARDEHGMNIVELGCGATFALAVVGRHPPHLHLGAMLEAARA